MGTDFHPDVASQLRVFAGTRAGGITLCTGKLTLPYVDWIQDGMSMSSRLLIHTENDAIIDLVRPHYSTDIRVATHLQELSSFLSDIEEHRFDMVLIDANDIGEHTVREVTRRVGDHGLLVGVGAPAALERLNLDLEGTHFSCRLGDSAHCIAFSRKGLQHRASRRGGRRGRSSAKTRAGRLD